MLGELRATTTKFLDAFLGREGLRVDEAALRAFYEHEYLSCNPELDTKDSALKVTLLRDVCRQAGIVHADSVLEVGCGAGAVLAGMAEALTPRRIAGIDYSPSIAEVARKRLPSAEVLVSDGEGIPFADGEFELVYFADVLEHVLRPTQWLRSVARVARRVAFLIPLESGFVADTVYAIRRVRGRRTNYEQYGHIWRFGRNDALRIVADAGLTLVAHQVHSHTPDYTFMNARGRALVRAREVALRASPRLAEDLFGTCALLGVAERRG